MITVNDIYNSIEGKVNTVSHPVYCASTREAVPESFPACHILCVGQARSKANVDFGYADKQKRFTFEVQTFSRIEDGGQTEANTVMDYAEAAFNDIKFLCTFRQDIDNRDPSLHRVVARFERVIGDSDTL